MTDLLTVEDLQVAFDTPGGRVEAVRGVSFGLGRERLGIVGESGSGKTMTGRAILRLIQSPGQVTARRLEFEGQDLLGLPERRMRALRGRRLAMVMQDPKYSLNPVMTIGRQLTEGLRRRERLSSREAAARAVAMLEAVRGVSFGLGRERLSSREAAARAVAMLEAVQIRDPERVMRAYPHELSGGMGQRVMIAMMLIPEPDLLIADEPTSALDVTVEAEVLRILDDLVRERGLALIFISHDLPLVARFCDRVLVMYAGKVVEALQASDLERAEHPYTRGLLRCLPRVGGSRQPLATLSRDPAWAL